MKKSAYLYGMVILIAGITAGCSAQIHIPFIDHHTRTATMVTTTGMNPLAAQNRALQPKTPAIGGVLHVPESVIAVLPAPQVSTVPKGEVALTIDDGPSPYTDQIVRTLAKYHVRATFFFIGGRVKEWPQAVKDAVANGDVIGDHTVDHHLLTSMTYDQQYWEIAAAVHEIQAYDPNPVTLFRPPYEGFNNVTQLVLNQNHMAMALWNRDPRDWDAKTPAQIVKAVLDTNPSGGVYDMHDIRATMLALPAIIEGLQKKGLKLVVLRAPQ